jgi:hypothetical protein
VDDGLKQSPRSYAKIIEDCCPFYLSIGMTSDEYWNGDSKLPKYYRESHKMKQEQKNHEAWLNGLYVYDALVSAMSHLSSKKSEHRNYADKPYSFNSENIEKDKEAKKLEAEAQAEVWLKSWVAATQKMFKDK